MITLRTDILDVPVAKSVILQNREANTYQRTFVFRNLTGVPLTLYLEKSPTGGLAPADWDDIEPGFVVGAAGGGTDIVIKNVTDGNLIRVQGQGGSEDRDLQVSLTTVYLDTHHIWTTPAL